MQEELLVKRSLKGSHEAFEQLVLKYEKSIYNIAYHYVLEHEQALDLTQETFLQAYQSLGALKDQSSFGAWLKRICRNKCLDHLRKNKEQILSLEEMMSEEGAAPQLPADKTTPESTLHQKEDIAHLERLLKDLPDDYRQVLVLRAFEEYSYEEIAQITGTSLGTVKSRIFRAKKMLKEQYEKRERE